MTCIVGIEYKGKVYMGGDSAGGDSYDTRIYQRSKVFKKDGLLIGYTWSFRMGQLIEFSDKIPAITDDRRNGSYQYLINAFIPALRDIFRDGGFLTKKDGFETGGVFLIGIRGELFRVQSDFSILRSVDGFDACGCGENYALGAMRILQNNDYNLPPESRISEALEAAEHFSSGVKYPFTILYL